MPDLKKQTPRQRAQMSYMMDVMRRLEWDLHNSIEMTGRIPAEWHEIAQKRPVSGKEKVTLRRKGKDTERSEVLATPDEAPKADAEASGAAGDGKVKAGVSVGGGK